MPEDGISVVCPTFNSSSYIFRAIESILAQEESPKEVVFSDDGSIDGTADLIESHRQDFKRMDINLIILRNQHEGPGAARNRGIETVTKQWIAFLDSDDTWKPNKLLRIRQEILQNERANLFIHWEEHHFADGQKRLLEHGKQYNTNKNLPTQLYRSNFLSTSAIVCRRNLIENVGGFDASLPNGQDYDLWLRMSPFMHLHIIPEILGSYIDEPKSITARPYNRRISAKLRIAWRHRDKGGTILFIYKLLRILISRQWFSSF
jgi:O-antigen biosynthesis protein